MPRKRNADLNRKEPVHLRQRRIKNGGYSLYLDIYWNGKRTYDFLKFYLNLPTDDLAVIENRTTLELAKQSSTSEFWNCTQVFMDLLW